MFFSAFLRFIMPYNYDHHNCALTSIYLANRLLESYNLLYRKINYYYCIRSLIVNEEMLNNHTALFT